MWWLNTVFLTDICIMFYLNIFLRGEESVSTRVLPIYALQTSSLEIKQISEWFYYSEQDLDILFFFFSMPMFPYLPLIIIFQLLQHEKHTWFPDCTSDLFQSTAVCLMNACGLFPFPWNYKKKRERRKRGRETQIRKEFANLSVDYSIVKSPSRLQDSVHAYKFHSIKVKRSFMRLVTPELA